MSGTRNSPIWILEDDNDDSLRKAADPPPYVALASKKRKKSPTVICIEDDELQYPPTPQSQVQKNKHKKAKLMTPPIRSPSTQPVREAKKKNKKAKLAHSPMDTAMETMQEAPPQAPAFSNSWVQSMAQAAEPNMFDLLVGLPPPPDWPGIPPFPPPFLPPPFPFLPFLDNALPPLPVETVQKKWPSIIGMPRERDTLGRRSAFVPTQSTLVGPCPTQHFIPDPAQTLVLDQLPKTSRTPEFFEQWSNKACSSAPIFVAIDASQAKALISFATPDLAKRAWCSPRLKAGSLGKGAPREDLIRAWWYRPADPPTSFSAPVDTPIEEGEIVETYMVVDEDFSHLAERSKHLHPQVQPSHEPARTGQALSPSPANYPTPKSLTPVPNVLPQFVQPVQPVPPANIKLPSPRPSVLPQPVLPTITKSSFTTDALTVSTVTERRNSSSREATPRLPAPETLAAEERLRQLVLASKRKPNVPTVPRTPSESTPLPTPSDIQQSSSLLPQTTTVDSLDDLANSFITEAIQAAKPALASTARLAALDEEIAQRNLLLSKLTTAKTKEERTSLLLLLRQRDRSLPAPPVAQLRWPSFEMQECVLILSDDDSDGDGDDDDA